MSDDLRRVQVRIPLRRPVRGVGSRQITLVGGPAGWGEASPFPGFDCSPARAEASARDAALHAPPPARRHRVEVNALVPEGSVAETVERARGAVESGYSVLKLKVSDLHDVERVTAVRRAVGPEVRLRVDGNAAMPLDAAHELCQALERLDLELFEQPVPGLDDLARLRERTNVPLAADESVRSRADAERLRTIGAADLLVLKVQPLGGVGPALAVAEAAGCPALVTGMIESSVGLATGLALAAALPELDHACGLGTAPLLAGDVTTEPLIPRNGHLGVRRVAPDEELLRRWADRSGLGGER